MADHHRILLERLAAEGSHTLDAYERTGGYQASRKALGMAPDAIIDEVKRSGLRGRGGAGFPTGTKWGFIQRDGPRPTYLVHNADESEPGTFKDRLLLERDPHAVIDGMICSAVAIGCRRMFTYIRGEYAYAAARFAAATDEAYAKGYLGTGIFGSSYDLEHVVHVGAGAYICGEETGLLESLEGKKGFPRIKPPFPAVVGLFGSPTVVNNTETLAAVPWILVNGGDAYRAIGTERSPGTKLFSVSGPVRRPGVYEVDLGYPMSRFLEEECGGLLDGVTLKGVIPGGSSVPIMTPDEVAKANLDYESIRDNGSLLGSGGFIVCGDNVPAAEALLNLMRFYAHESCGQCTPCREGCGWLEDVADRLLDAAGDPDDLHLVRRLSENMMGKTICALADGAAMPALALVTKYRAEFEPLLAERRVRRAPARHGLVGIGGRSGATAARPAGAVA
ncbi:MAG TPA: NADH-quinone oxidoreductase subunit NuoF [Gemmatimonadota bacterium]|jgi:NADH-quinone oxidoreductase subunit F